MSKDDQNLEQKVIELVREATKLDEELRQKYQIGEKFRFVRDRLHALLAHLEENLPKVVQAKKEMSYVPQENEVVLYIHLYNVHGPKFNTWQNMVNPKVLYEYSVNRPIYKEKSALESVIKNKPNPVQHAYIAIAVSSLDLISNGNGHKDSMGNLLVRVKEGSLHISKLVSFVHNNQEYLIDSKGNLVKKSS